MPAASPASLNSSRPPIERCSSSAAPATCRLKSDSICCVVRTPTIVANPHRMTSVSTAEPPASRQRIGSRLYAEDVPCAADRMKEPRLSTGFQLPPEIRHEHLDRVRDGERVVAPHLVEQLLARDDEALVAHEVLEQLELALRELDLAVAAAHLVRVGIERQVAHPQRRHPARRPTAQQCPQAREQLLALERLDEAVVGADVEPFHARVERVARGEHEDRRVVVVAPQPPRDVDPVEPGQPEVEHDQVGQERVDVLERLDAVARELDLVALPAQRALEDLRDVLVVLDDEHANGAVRSVHGCLEDYVRELNARYVPGRNATVGVEASRDACPPPPAVSRAPAPDAPRRRPRRGATGCPRSTSATGI